MRQQPDVRVASPDYTCDSDEAERRFALPIRV
jgi:hypothetical protein